MNQSKVIERGDYCETHCSVLQIRFSVYYAGPYNKNVSKNSVFLSNALCSLHFSETSQKCEGRDSVKKFSFRTGWGIIFNT